VDIDFTAKQIRTKKNFRRILQRIGGSTNLLKEENGAASAKKPEHLQILNLSTGSALYAAVGATKKVSSTMQCIDGNRNC